MITKSIQIGDDTYTVSGNSLKDVLREANELDVISRRAKEANLKYRKGEDYEFFEAVKYEKIEGRYYKVYKQLGQSDDGLFLSANEPWRMYDKESETNFVKFDYLTDTVREWGFDDNATEEWIPAESKKKGKQRIYVPV